MDKPQPERLITPPTADELREMGFGHHLINRTTHPYFYASCWPPSNGAGTKKEHQLPHLNLNSILITVIGNHWCEGGWWRLQDMIKYTI